MIKLKGRSETRGYAEKKRAHTRRRARARINDGSLLFIRELPILNYARIKMFF